MSLCKYEWLQLHNTLVLKAVQRMGENLDLPSETDGSFPIDFNFSAYALTE